jgi:phosphate transport system substrate-binding protein
MQMDTPCRRKRNWILRLPLALAACIVLFLGGAFLWITSLFAGGEKFYSPLILILTFWLMGVAAAVIFGGRSRKWGQRALVLAAVVSLLAITGHEGIRAYHRRFEQVVEREPNLGDYRPFDNEGRLATLDEPATLFLADNVPRLDGATALYPVYAAFVQAVYPRDGDYNPHSGDVRCSKTGAAYDRLIRGETDIIFVARPSKAHLEQARQMHVELRLTPIGREAFVFFVNQRNPVQGLTTRQILDIYSGEITDWHAVGGLHQPIRAFQRPENSGSQTMLQHLMEGRTLMKAPSEDVVGGMGGIIARTANYRNYPNAIGYTFLYFATGMIGNGAIRLLEVDGIAPTRETIRDGTYPFSTELYAVTAGSRNPNVPVFMEWIRSPQGQALLEKTGYTSVQAIADRSIDPSRKGEEPLPE